MTTTVTSTRIEGIPQSDEIRHEDHGEFYVRMKIKTECGGGTQLLRLTSNGIPFMGEFAVTGTPMKAADGEFGWHVTEAAATIDQTYITMLATIQWAKILRPDFYEGRLVEVESVYSPYQPWPDTIITPNKEVK
jgi:hypothetical protein|tara:strand:- start:2803 stop:3204 length:402 start_codon:yes stop_codon:yes gene_type:complete